MNNMATRHRRHALKAMRAHGGPPRSPNQKYVITDPSHMPDLRGEFAGQPVVIESGQHYVWLTDRQARFYLDQGAIQLADWVEPAPETA